MGGAAGVNFVQPFVYSLRNRIHFAAKADDVRATRKDRRPCKIRALLHANRISPKPNG